MTAGKAISQSDGDIDIGWGKWCWCYSSPLAFATFTPIDSNFESYNITFRETFFPHWSSSGWICNDHHPKKLWDGIAPWGRNWRMQIIEGKGPAGQCKVQGSTSLDQKSYHWRSLIFEYHFLKTFTIQLGLTECWIWCYHARNLRLF